MRSLLTLLLGFGTVILGCQAACNVCASGSNVACISETQFQFCSDNQATGPTYRCPKGRYCTSQISICGENESLKACGSDGCDECSDQRSFACTGAHTFVLCPDANRPANITGRCYADLVCNRDLPEICASAATTTASCPNGLATTAAPTRESTTDSSTDECTTFPSNPTASTPTWSTPTWSMPTWSTPTESTTTESTTTDSSPTHSNPIDLDEFCQDSFKGIPIHAIPNDTECTSYIYCRYYIQSFVGRIIECTDSKPYFNGRTLCCGDTKPTLPGCL